MDHFGIGHGLTGASRVYFQSGRRTGRTTSLVDSLKNGDRVVFTSCREGNRVQTLCRERGVEIEVFVCDPKSPERLFHVGNPIGNQRCIFDHSWVQEYYENAIGQAVADIDSLQTKLSGIGEKHRETERAARELSTWR